MRLLAPVVLDHGLGLVVSVMVVVALVLFSKQWLSPVHLVRFGADGACGDGEDDRYDDEGSHHGDGDDLSQGDGARWRQSQTL